MKKSTTVKQYIDNTPKEVRELLEELRALIRTVAPTATERISYNMPFYEYKGRLVYFSSAKNYIGIYIPPPIIAGHAKELKDYKTTKSAIHIPLKTLPVTLIKKLLRARMKYNELKNKEQLQ